MDRITRVNSLLKETIAFIVERKLKDPGIGMVTIHDVDVSRDLRNAKVYFGVIDLSSKSKSEAALNRASAFIRKELGKEVTLRYIPKLTFIYDESIEKGERIFNILRRIKKHEEPQN